jgi:hypothetical protein
MFISDFGSADEYKSIFKSFTDDEADAIKQFLESYSLHRGFKSLPGQPKPLAVSTA